MNKFQIDVHGVIEGKTLKDAVKDFIVGTLSSDVALYWGFTDKIGSYGYKPIPQNELENAARHALIEVTPEVCIWPDDQNNNWHWRVAGVVDGTAPDFFTAAHQASEVSPTIQRRIKELSE